MRVYVGIKFSCLCENVLQNASCCFFLSNVFFLMVEIMFVFMCLSTHSLSVTLSQDGHVEVARLLLDSGAQVNMPADSFESPLTLAACGGHVELAALLIERGANLEEVRSKGTVK